MPPTKDSSGNERPVAHATTTGMTGSGFYNDNSAPQWKATEHVLPWLDDTIPDLPLQGNGPLSLSDFGCSEGKNSIAVMSRVVNSVLPLTKRPLQTIHSDLPTNDFSQLFLSLRPNGQSIFGSERVFSAAVGGSMYDQLLPDRSLHLATTFNAIGFLSERPLKNLPGYNFPNGPSAIRANGFVSEEDRTLFSDLAKNDIARFLKARAHELVSGGKLLIQVFGCHEGVRTCDGIYDLLNDAVLEFVNAGEITRETYDAYYQPVYMRTLDELTAPVTDEAFGVSDLFSLDKSLSYEIDVPFNLRYQQDGNVNCYARDYVNFFRAFTEAVLRNSLPAKPDRQVLVDKIYSRAEALLIATPERYPFRYAAVAMLLTRA